MLRPPDLHPGDLIAVISPAGKARRPATDMAVEVLRARGWRVRVMDNALGECGSMSGTCQERLADITAALLDDEVKAILCSRGGYGAVHLLGHLSPQLVRAHAKWLIGFSDISALHALWLRAGVQSIHGPMAKHIVASAEQQSANALDLPRLEGILTGGSPTYRWEAHPLNHSGSARGILVGGNFSVLSALAATPYDVFATPGAILFIEDINEPVYKIERLLYRLLLSGNMANIKGIVVGDFTGVAPDVNHASMYDMIHNATSRVGIPVAMAFPAGHGSSATPLILGAEAELNVARESALIIS